MRSKVLVTGGSGYLGSVLCWKLLQKGVDVVSVDLNYHPMNGMRGLTVLSCDLRDVDLVNSLFSNYKFDAVFHCAGLIDVAESNKNPSKYYDYNVVISLNLLNAASRKGVKNFIFSSSAAVYGDSSHGVTFEDSKLKPLSVYGKTKLIVEQMLPDFYYAFGMNYVVLRYFNVAGAVVKGSITLGERHDPETHLIPRAIRAVSLGLPVEVFGFELQTFDGSAVRDFVHVEDVAEANYLALNWLAGKKENEVFNICSGKGVSVLQVLREVESISKRSAIVKQSLPRVGDPTILVGSFRKAQENLAWKPENSDITKIVKDAFIWYKLQTKQQLAGGVVE